MWAISHGHVIVRKLPSREQDREGRRTVKSKFEYLPVQHVIKNITPTAVVHRPSLSVFSSLFSYFVSPFSWASNAGGGGGRGTRPRSRKISGGRPPEMMIFQ